MSKKEQSYFFEIELLEDLLLKLRNFADEQKEDFNVCILRTLEEGLKIRRRNKELYQDALSRTLEETESNLRGAL